MNPNGQWLWVQRQTGQNIGEAIADHLIRYSPADPNRELFFSIYGGKKCWESMRSAKCIEAGTSKVCGMSARAERQARA
jgi:hypothetical protein